MRSTFYAFVGDPFLQGCYMNLAELNHLGTQVDQLMHAVESLRLENASLRQKIAVHAQDRARLQHKNQRASKQIRQIIKQIQEEIA